MLIREYNEGDLAALQEIHARRELPYRFPELQSPLFLSKIVLEDESRIVAASLLRLTAEAYFLLDPAFGDPRSRWMALKILHETARGDAVRKGLDDVHCWVPPALSRTFGKRIEQLGWQRERWDCYSRSLAETTPELEG